MRHSVGWGVRENKWGSSSDKCMEGGKEGRRERLAQTCCRGASFGPREGGSFGRRKEGSPEGGDCRE